MINFEQNMALAKSILEQAPEAAKNVAVWNKQPEPPGCTSYFGSVADKDVWSFVLVKFPSGPEYTEGHDGTVTKNNIIVRTPRDIAEELYKHAESSFGKQG
jgi:hypothetical protein